MMGLSDEISGFFQRVERRAKRNPRIPGGAQKVFSNLRKKITEVSSLTGTPLGDVVIKSVLEECEAQQKKCVSKRGKDDGRRKRK